VLAFRPAGDRRNIDVVAGEVGERATTLGALSLVFRKVDPLQLRPRVARIGNGVEARRLPLIGSRRRETEHGLRGEMIDEDDAEERGRGELAAAGARRV
jgi:hypothetical protein